MRDVLIGLSVDRFGLSTLLKAMLLLPDLNSTVLTVSAISLYPEI